MTKILNHELYWNIDWHKHLPFVAFIGQRPPPSGGGSSHENNEDPFKKIENDHKFKDSFGEIFTDLYALEIFLYDYEQGRLFRLKHDFAGWDPMTVLFCQHKAKLDLYVQVYEREAIRKGIYYCFNKSSQILLVAIESPEQSNAEEPGPEPNPVGGLSASVSNLTPDLYFCHSPFLSPNDERLYFLCRPEVFIQHNICFELRVMSRFDDFSRKAKLIGTVPKCNDRFVGLSSLILHRSQRHFLHNGDFLLFTSELQNRSQIFLIDCRRKADRPGQGNAPTRADWLVTPDSDGSSGSDVINLSHRMQSTGGHEFSALDSTISDCRGGILIFESQSVTCPPFVSMVDLGDEEQLQCLFADRTTQIKPFPVFQSDSPTSMDWAQSVRRFGFGLSHSPSAESVFGYAPSQLRPEARLVPWVCVLHGGPFSSTRDRFDDLAHLTLASGLGWMAINYRGSSGFGSEYQNVLTGRGGELSVQDCVEAISRANEYGLDPRNVIVIGNSFGGYLTARLVEDPRMAGRFRSAILINPLIDVHNFTIATDLNEWAFAVFCNEKKTLSEPVE